MSKCFSPMKTFLNRYLEELRQKPQIFIAFVLLNFPYVIQCFFENQHLSVDTGGGMHSVAAAFFRTAFFAYLIDFLLKAIPFPRIRWCLQLAVLGLSALFFFLDTFALSCYHCVVDQGMLAILFETNPREAVEFVEMFIFERRYVFWMAATAFMLAIVYFALLRIARYKIASLILLAVSLGCSLKFAEFFPVYSSLARYGTMIASTVKEKRAYDAMSAQIGIKEITLTKNDSSIPYIIFVLGESTSKNHMSLYGYRLPTTPLLSARSRQEGFYVFQDVISHHSHTSAVLEELFTFYRHQAPGRWFDYENIFDIVKAAGYRTAWISNQESFGFWGNVANHYADRCEYKKYVMMRDSLNSASAKYDEEVLPLLDTWLQAKNDKNFCVVHLLGTHFEYIYRYPVSFRVFSETDEPGADEKEKRVRSEYDNAVRYNDFVVNEIIRRFEDKNAILIYVSDHAEHVYDEPGLTLGHDENNANRYMVEIPMIIWMSESCRATYSGLEQRIAASVDRPFMTDDMIHVLLDIMGIETESYDPAKSVIHDQFDAGRVRVYGNGVEYKRRMQGADAK